MAVGDILDFNLAGVYCGVPVSIGMAYSQALDDEPGESPGRRLIDRWFGEPNGAWQSISFGVSENLVWECATVTYGASVESEFLTDARGGSSNPSLPSPIALQVNIDSQDPWPGSKPGRFYMPGLFEGYAAAGAWVNSAIEDVLDGWMKALREVDDQGPSGPRFRLYPHAKYVTRAGDTNIIAETPTYNYNYKVIGSRRADACVAFAGQGASPGEPIIVPPPVQQPELPT